MLKHDDLNPPGETTPNGETPLRGEDTSLLLCVCVFKHDDLKTLLETTST